MRTLSALLCLSTYILLAVAAVASPNSDSSPSSKHAKRWESGPMMSGINFPDPSVIQVDGVWYSFATRTKGSNIHIQIAQSYNFRTWSIVNDQDGSQRDALPNLPSWVDSSSWNTWAPDVQQLSDGTFVMYYSATMATHPSKHCVGAAFANNVTGPYVAQSSTLICPLSEGGAIDAAGYEDNGQRYVVYKVDGNSMGHGGVCGNTKPPIVSTPIVLQPVAQDGVTPQGSPISIMDNYGAVDQGCVEAPSLVRVANTYVLFFSSGCFNGPNYTVNYATSGSITGPYTRVDIPLFTTGDYGLKAPGGMTIYRDGQHMVFHANYGKGRALYAAIVTIEGVKVTA